VSSTATGMRPAKPGSRATNALLVVASVVATLGLLEAGMRAYYGGAGLPTSVTFGSNSEIWKQRWLDRHRDQGLEVYYGFDQYHPLFGWSTKPNLHAYRFDGLPPITSNTQGWRALRDYSYERSAGVTRIVVLGDSFTFGERARDEEVWTVQLEQQLDHTEVFNLGVHGYGTDQQLRVLEEEGIRYHPDVVVLGFFVEDILRNGLAFRDYAKPMFVLRDNALILTNSPVPPPQAILAEAGGQRPWSYLAHFLRHRFSGDHAATLDDVVEARDLFRLTRAILQKMQDVTTAGGAHLLVVIIPGRLQMPQVEAALKQWAGEIGYAVIDVGPGLAAAAQTFQRPVYRDFYHTTLGDLVMATAVARTLVERGWVPAPSEETMMHLRQRFREVIEQSPPS